MAIKKKDEQQSSASARATVRNQAGIHCRPAAAIVKAAREFEADVRVRVASGESADVTSAIELLALGLEKGQTVEVQGDGAAARDCVDKLVAMIETEYDFPNAGTGRAL